MTRLSALFAKLLDDLGLNQAPSGIATSLEEALEIERAHV